ncbi:hypothetical protein DL766_002464 [Monosporascus sp. MC13-8B]|uniref:AMP-dependent synthetase/ligase domain-containing protein n=1 Tax=Monosporascus cannonballus TaxID=155416 RepID=A0ABY0HDK7_9PEZI|nr:hypothetical protein DL762_002863 [Monosporascus cannonballus]RYO95600.1 hypothetical protein DL763_003670 [Monosporascus cannonballus]RYP35453.1 hypothetical protein DL766_002464 [Monosporascus sp. MC13-8B]
MKDTKHHHSASLYSTPPHKMLYDLKKVPSISGILRRSTIQKGLQHTKFPNRSTTELFAQTTGQQRRQPPDPFTAEELRTYGCKHAALIGRPAEGTRLTRRQWASVNRTLRAAAERALASGLAWEGGKAQGAYVVQCGLGAALQLSVQRAGVRRRCSLADPRLARRVRAMAADVSQKRFRHDGVWFEFKMLDLGTALLPVEEQGGGGFGDDGDGDEEDEEDEDEDEEEEEQQAEREVGGRPGRNLGVGPIITICG